MRHYTAASALLAAVVILVLALDGGPAGRSAYAIESIRSSGSSTRLSRKVARWVVAGLERLHQDARRYGLDVGVDDSERGLEPAITD
jgi:uncharacterized membrane protein